jgi:hypothetical protein
MFVAGTTMSAAAKNPYLVYKIALLQSRIFIMLQIYPITKQTIMKYFLILLMLPLFSNSECGNKKNAKEAKTDSVVVKQPEPVKDSLPACVRGLINKAMNEQPPTTPLQVDEYSFNSKTVYLVTPPCCDFFNEVYDDSCKIICAPSGGITGKGDGKCPDFFKSATFVKTLWKPTGK